MKNTEGQNSTYPQYLDGIGSCKGTHRLALGTLPVALAARCHSATDLIEEVEFVALEDLPASWSRFFGVVLPPRRFCGGGAVVAPDAMCGAKGACGGWTR